MRGVLFCRKVNLSLTQGALCTVSVFFILHFTYLGGTHPTHPPAYGPADAQCCHRTNLYIYYKSFFRRETVAREKTQRHKITNFCLYYRHICRPYMLTATYFAYFPA